MSGTIPLSMTQQFDVYGEPLAGGQLFIIQAGTVATPQNPYQDAGLTLVMPNPITLDAAGRIPQFFLADGYIKVRLTDTNGVVQLAADGILVIGPSAGGSGGGAAVDPTSVMQTGDMKFRHDTAIVSGFVRLNGKTIGAASSGATELADPTAQALFNYLWNKDASLIVTPSRGASSAADWTANKQIALPDWRGYALGALDDMGNTAAGRLGAYFANATVLGSVGGAPSAALASTNLPTHTHSGTTQPESVQHTHNIPAPATKGTPAIVSSGASAFFWTGSGSDVTGPESQSHVHTITTDGGSGLAATPFGIIAPRKLITFYMKLAIPLVMSFPLVNMLCENFGM